MRLSLALLAASFLLALAPAGAGAYMTPGEPVADPQVDGWVAVARATWGADPACPEGVRIDRAERLPGAGLWAAAEMPGCHVSLDPDFYPAPALWTATDAGREQWEEQMCNVVVHEWGHLLGRPHAADPADLMAPVVPTVVAGCGADAAPAVVPPAPRAATKPAPKAKRARKRSRRRATRRPLARRSTRPHIEAVHGAVFPTFQP